MAQQDSRVNIVMFGSISAVHFGPENILLGQEQSVLRNTEVSQIVPVTSRVSGRNVSVIDILGLEETDLPPHTVHQFISRLVNENEIHAFIFVLQLNQLTDTDKLGLEWLKSTFGERALAFVMILFTYESEEECDTIIDDLKNNTVLEQLTQQCGGRYCTCSKSMNHQSEMGTLLENIDHLISENSQCCYTAELYTAAFRGLQDRQNQQTAANRLLLQEEVDNKEDLTNQPEVISPKPDDEDCKPDFSEELKDLFSRVLGNHNQIIKSADILQIIKPLLQYQESSLHVAFLQKLLMVNYNARYISVDKQSREEPDFSPEPVDEDQESSLSGFFDTDTSTSDPINNKQIVHPMDVQMAVFHCSDHFLKQLIVTKLSQCQYALPLLVPNPFTREIEFPLWTFHQIRKSWKVTDESGKVINKAMSISVAQTPMVAFFRLGSASLSKSQLMNNLINEKHHTFFHRDCRGSSRNRLLMDGVVEIAWYCPSGKETDYFPDCVAFCNLHGDAETNQEQLHILTEESSVNVVLLSEQKDTKNNIILNLLQSPKPLICLFTKSNEGVTRKKNLKFKIGLEQRNQSDISEVLRNTLKKCFTSAPKFRLENMGAHGKIRTDEEDGKCQKGKEAALQMTKLFHGMELSKVKETYMVCQGKLWHDWCQKNKELHRLQGATIEMKKCEKQTEMKTIRKQQYECGVTNLMEMFIHTLNSPEVNDKEYFLRWIVILLDNYTIDELPRLRDSQLQDIPKQLNATAFGLEHILREMGQIYESFISVQTHEEGSLREDFTCLPKLGADVMLSGYPLELMDGNAAHIPLIWVSAVLDELVKILGDQRVFVLSVLGIQSSGKSTMLNAMFGLQFAVSAGRCTRGAFMQLVRVSEEMKKELKFDYILVVDTEGLRALELAGKTSIHHDNELATFVVGLGNLTLINIFGENPAEMQDILQIVVQAFLRMKKVRLYPRCMFIHQNVGDITAGEKTMEGRRCLLGKLDEMTKLASKEEDCDAQCFSDIIAFDVQNDVRYFAQLWEGSPPMGPPNPSYSENVDELKRNIFSNIKINRVMSLSQFKSHLSNLWNALLNENFVFSFKNSLEIAVYRKLENEYCKWTWNLRSSMSVTENKLFNRINNERDPKIDENDIMADMKDTKLDVDKSIEKFFNEDKDKETLNHWQKRFERKVSDLYNDLVKATKRKLDKIACLKIAREKIDQEKTKREIKLYKQSKDLAMILKSKETDEDTLRTNFEDVWEMWVAEVTKDAPSVDNINIWGDVIQTLSESYEDNLVCERQRKAAYKKFECLGDYSDYIILNKQQELHQEDLQSQEHVEREDESPGALVHTVRDGPSEGTMTLTSEENKLFRALIGRMIKDTEEEIQRKPIAEQGYSQIYIPEIIASIKNHVRVQQTQTSRYKLKKEFTVDLCLHVCSFAANQFNDLHMKFKEANNVEVYLKKQKPQYFNIFKNYYNGASSAAVFGEFIVDKLEPSILQAAYDQTAIDVAEKMKRNVPAFSGNRSNLEKHILTSLAEDEDFESYIEYIHKPKEHFNHFITKEVNQYILTDKGEEVLETIKTNIKSKTKCVMDAVNRAAEDVSKRNGDIDMWLENFSKELKDELQFKEESCPEQKEITDLGFLQELVNQDLTDTMEKLCSEFKTISDLKQEMFRKKPNEILIEHLCRCCWVQCPFCNAICTNTMEDHDGDHRVRFHRNCGVNGWSFMFSENLGVDFCTTAVSSNMFFRTSAGVFAFKEYRKAGGDYAKWNISPDTSEMPYWKWFVCRFQEDLEKHYKRKFTGNGEIPHEWREITKARAIESLSEL
ncbi:interferon-induced very large GTPase 1-like [Neoarius graeffei]|uniref:interferon-induced very large GTPase 1-like n=1 Tax=Neoarius graeffei TaxID=443677 RepID=UPI00298CAC66|nr:interferon-induced very large GTPase 1-like [Neoarius graeffei]XP_060760109.1 interferon-induced very large GTPase 1-like [Neoarius graeffei]XP_060760110.1 interferon-induced very large GTPase 1-like [Neoarius graeffei]XP_060760111.1 interferon-induced very large GTPase 1-like [Neoarius graeffei]